MSQITDEQSPCAQQHFLSLRYLESCNIPVTVKRKYQFSSNTTSSNSDDDKKAPDDCVQVSQENPGMTCGTCPSTPCFNWVYVRAVVSSK